MNTKFGFFPYQAMNYKAAQRWLDRKAEQGWSLKHVHLGCLARFQKVEKTSHFVDLDIRSAYDDPDADYLQLCSDAGWELVQRLRGMLIFRAAPGASPVPIQTDGELEWERFWEKYRPRIWTTLLVLASMALLALMLAILPRGSITSVLATNQGLLYGLYLMLGIVYILFEGVHSKWYLARCRRSGQVEDPGVISTLLDSIYCLSTPLLCLILLLGFVESFWGKTVDLSLYPINDEYSATVEACREWPVLMASDLGLPDSKDSRRLTGHRSLLVDFLEYRELTDGEGPEPAVYILTTERYDCISESLAKLVMAQRKRETKNGAFLWGELEWEFAPGLGFDESFTCREHSYLLFREDNVVALVGCRDFDLTSPQGLEAICERVLNRSS